MPSILTILIPAALCLAALPGAGPAFGGVVRPALVWQAAQDDVGDQQRNNDMAAQMVGALLADVQAHIRATGSADGLERVLEPYFAFDLWGRFLMEPRAQAFSEAQKASFAELLPPYIASLYFQRFGGDPNRPAVIGEARAARRDIVVRSDLPRSSGSTLRVDWRLRAGRSGMRVIDIIGGGASFLLLTRDEFMSIVDRDGADGLLAYMRQRGR